MNEEYRPTPARLNFLRRTSNVPSLSDVYSSLTMSPCSELFTPEEKAYYGVKGTEFLYHHCLAPSTSLLLTISFHCCCCTVLLAASDSMVIPIWISCLFSRAHPLVAATITTHFGLCFPVVVYTTLMGKFAYPEDLLGI